MKGEFVFAVPGDLATPTGGYAYDRRMIAELSALGWRPQVVDLGEGFPKPTALTRAAARSRLLDVPHGRRVVVDGLAFGVLPDVAAELRVTHPLFALVHHPLALESGLAAAERDMLRTSERAALAYTLGVIATSATTARVLAADYDVDPARITVAAPGTDRVVMAPRKAAGPVALISVGSIVPRKGYDVLIAALATLIDLDWRLTVVGDCSRNPAAVAQLEADIARFGLSSRVAIEDAVPSQRLAELYASADLFVLASRYEGYGMAYAEAMAHGLPVIGTTAGAIPETVPAGAGVLVPPEDRDALAAAVRTLIEDREQRARLAAGARAAAEKLPTWAVSAALFAQALERG